jgi:hypothetical protein
MFKKLSSLFQSQPQKPKQTPFEIYQGLRYNILSIDPNKVGLAPKPGVNASWGVVTDLGVAPSGYMTLVSLVDGTTSMYTSSGGGMIGAGENKAGAPAQASVALVMAAEKFYRLMQPTKVFPLPSAGNVRFYVLTSYGVYSAEFPQLTPADDKHPFFELYAFAQNVITELRLLDEKQKQKK